MDSLPIRRMWYEFSYMVHGDNPGFLSGDVYVQYTESPGLTPHIISCVVVLKFGEDEDEVCKLGIIGGSLQAWRGEPLDTFKCRASVDVGSCFQLQLYGAQNNERLTMMVGEGNEGLPTFSCDGDWTFRASPRAECNDVEKLPFKNATTAKPTGRV